MPVNVECRRSTGYLKTKQGYHISIYPKVGNVISEMTTLRRKYTKNNAIQSKHLIHS